MWDVNLLAAMRTIERTMPMVVYRFLSSLAVGFAYMMSVLGGAGMGFAAGSYGSNPGSVAGVGAFIGFGACAWLLHKLRPSLLHAVRASHLLILVENREGKTLPVRKAQVDYAKQAIATRFPKVSGLAELDGSLRACLRAMTCLGCDLNACLPIKHPQAGALVKTLLSPISATLGDVVLAALMRRQEQNDWRSGLAAVESCAAQWNNLYKNAAWMYGFMYAGWFVSFLVIQAPVLNIASALPMSAGIWPVVFALVLSWVLKAAFFEPIATAALMEYYFARIEGQTPDNETKAKLAGLEAYRLLQEKAKS